MHLFIHSFVRSFIHCIASLSVSSQFDVTLQAPLLSSPSVQMLLRLSNFNFCTLFTVLPSLGRPI